ncbi:hypothetical protein [Micromonospora sp. 4G55]|uniref:hypothetical protein n=1 Tax=Micromonospora sp. 4G55 TaxID=2806102 RepID=UPI001A63389C|nr:hypothetical protein [Micromonospora sp. 4G55]
MPAGPAADLVVVQADLAFAGLEQLLNAPAGPGDAHEGVQRHRCGRPAQVVGQLAGAAAHPDLARSLLRYAAHWDPYET